jgi:hypothetical protein
MKSKAQIGRNKKRNLAFEILFASTTDQTEND